MEGSNKTRYEKRAEIRAILSFRDRSAEEMEEDCGYQNFFYLPRRKFQSFLSKWCLLMLVGFFSCLIAVIGFALIYRLFPDGLVYAMPVLSE